MRIYRFFSSLACCAALVLPPLSLGHASETFRVDSIPSFDWVLETTSEEAAAAIRYEAMTYREGAEPWYESTFFGGDEHWVRVGRDWQHPGERASSIRAFTAPRSGEIAISGRASKAHIDAGTDGVDVAIRLNDETLLTEYIEGDDAKGILFYIRRRVEQGGVVRLCRLGTLIITRATRPDSILRLLIKTSAGESFSGVGWLRRARRRRGRLDLRISVGRTVLRTRLP